MNTSFHFTSAQDITPVLLDLIKQAYQKKPITIYIQDDEFVSQWQIQEVRRRDAITGNNPDCLLDCDTVIKELEKELETV